MFLDSTYITYLSYLTNYCLESGNYNVHIIIINVGVSGKDLYNLVWTAIRRLEEIGLHVVVIVSDGASNNRVFFKLHKDLECTKNGVVYKVKNIFAPSRY